MPRIVGNFSFNGKQVFPKAKNYSQAMAKNRPNPRDSLAHNVALLMRLHGYDQTHLAKLSGVNQKTISNVINTRNAANIDKIDAIASAFGLDAWHLILPNLPEEIASGGSIEQLVRNYIAADHDGREYITRVSEREADYKNTNR